MGHLANVNILHKLMYSSAAEVVDVLVIIFLKKLFFQRSSTPTTEFMTVWYYHTRGLHFGRRWPAERIGIHCDLLVLRYLERGNDVIDC